MGVTIITIKWSSSTAQDLITYLRAEEPVAVVVSKSAVAVAELAPPVVPVVVASLVIGSVVMGAVVVSASVVKADDAATVTNREEEEEEDEPGTLQ
jgi:hypothetical protein